MFYENYIRLCNSVHKSPSAVALEIGIAKPTVSRWKSGSRPNHATAVKVADYFGVPVSELESTETEKAPTLEDGREMSDKEIMFALWGDTDEVDEDDLADVRRYAAFIKERKKKK